MILLFLNCIVFYWFKLAFCYFFISIWLANHLHDLMLSSQVNVSLKKPGSRLEHQGIKIEFVGQIELYYDRGNHHEFTSLVKELARPGELTQNGSFEFEFNQVEKPYESYSGTNVRLRYQRTTVHFSPFVDVLCVFLWYNGTIIHP